jgi:hypothetical protein
MKFQVQSAEFWHLNNRFNFLQRTIITEVSQQEETPTGLYKNGQNWLMLMLHGREILTPSDGAYASF